MYGCKKKNGGRILFFTAEIFEKKKTFLFHCECHLKKFTLMLSLSNRYHYYHGALKNLFRVQNRKRKNTFILLLLLLSFTNSLM